MTVSVHARASESERSTPGRSTRAHMSLPPPGRTSAPDRAAVWGDWYARLETCPPPCFNQRKVMRTFARGEIDIRSHVVHVGEHEVHEVHVCCVSVSAVRACELYGFHDGNGKEACRVSTQASNRELSWEDVSRVLRDQLCLQLRVVHMNEGTKGFVAVRRTLPPPGTIAVPSCFQITEYISTSGLRSLLLHPGTPMWAFGKAVQSFYKQKQSLVIAGATVHVQSATVEYSNDKFGGRHYASVLCGDHKGMSAWDGDKQQHRCLSAQGASSAMRKPLYPFCHDVDMKMAHPTIVMYMAKLLDVHMPFLESYVHDKAEWIRRVSLFFDATDEQARDDTKALFNMVLNGGKPRTWFNKTKPEVSTKTFEQFIKVVRVDVVVEEVQRFQEALFTSPSWSTWCIECFTYRANQQKHNQWPDGRLKTTPEIKRGVVSRVVQAFESSILMLMCRVVEHSGTFQVHSLIFDGLQVFWKGTGNYAREKKELDELVQNLTTTVVQEYGCVHFGLAVKPLRSYN